MGRGNRWNSVENSQEVTGDELKFAETEAEETQEESGEVTSEPSNSAEGAETTEAELVANQSTNVDVSALSPTQILALLEQRRAEISTINKVAKDRGIKVPTKSKPKVEDKDRLDEFWEGLGYSIGMRRWADQRARANFDRAKGVAALLGEAFDVEKQAEAIELLGAGYIKARKQSSFKSEVMKTKEQVEGATPGDVLSEFWDSFDLSELEGLRDLLREAM